MQHRAIALAAMLCLAAPIACGQIPDKFRDADDGQLDMSDYLLRHRGVLPIPLIVTEPAVGYGGGVALAYFSQSFEERAEQSRARGERVAPPDIAVGFGIGTENGTRAGGAGYLGFWDQDRYRYMGAAGKAQLHLDYYNIGGDPRAYRLDAKAVVQSLLRRIEGTSWFAGGRFVYIDTHSRFDNGAPQDVPSRSLDTSIGKLGAVVDYDSRDNIFTPNRGSFLETEAAFARGAFGSSSNFETLYTRAYTWIPAGDFVIGLRGDAQLSGGDVPFYAQPFIALRGVPVARYQDRNAVMAETEVRWNLTPRWAAVGFAGVGKAFGRRQSWDEAETVVSRGAGFRYLVARKLGLYAGMDAAWGPQKSAVYIQVGGAWQ